MVAVCLDNVQIGTASLNYKNVLRDKLRVLILLNCWTMTIVMNLNRLR